MCGIMLAFYNEHKNTIQCHFPEYTTYIVKTAERYFVHIIAPQLLYMTFYCFHLRDVVQKNIHTHDPLSINEWPPGGSRYPPPPYFYYRDPTNKNIASDLGCLQYGFIRIGIHIFLNPRAAC